MHRVEEVKDSSVFKPDKKQSHNPKDHHSKDIQLIRHPQTGTARVVFQPVVVELVKPFPVFYRVESEPILTVDTVSVLRTDAVGTRVVTGFPVLACSWHCYKHQDKTEEKRERYAI